MVIIELSFPPSAEQNMRIVTGFPVNRSRFPRCKHRAGGFNMLTMRVNES